MIPALERVKTQSSDSTTSDNLLVRVFHDNGGPLTGNFSRVSQLLAIENGARSLEEESNFSMNHDNVYLKRLESPISTWQQAFLTSNKSIINSTSWGEYSNQQTAMVGVHRNPTRRKLGPFKQHY